MDKLIKKKNVKLRELLEMVLNELGLNEDESLEFIGLIRFIISKKKIKNPVDALRWLKTTTQEYFLRPPGIDRWDVEDSKLILQHKNYLLETLEKIRFIREIKPSLKHFKYVLFLGTVEEEVRNRLNFLEELWKEGVRFEQIFLLGSQRSLDPLIENTKIASNEMEMMKSIFNEHQVLWPEGLKKVPLIPVNTNMKLGEYERLQKPDTSDTIYTWFLLELAPAPVLVISNQPCVHYHHAVVKNILPNEYYVETVGDKANKQMKISVALDCIARWIYVSFPRVKKKLLSNLN
ncbi:MAG: hypothetical protein K0R94_1485 [Burkholderiales bacterium]|nr:hypothetical protein [Burkholderiales bacterium]